MLVQKNLTAQKTRKLGYIMSATTIVSDFAAMINSQAKMYSKCVGYKIDKDEALIACKHSYTYSLLKEAEQGKSSLVGASEMTALGQIKFVWNQTGGDPRGDQNLKVWMFWGDFELYYKIFSNKPTMHHLTEAWLHYKEEKRNGTWN